MYAIYGSVNHGTNEQPCGSGGRMHYANQVLSSTHILIIGHIDSSHSFSWPIIINDHHVVI